MVVTTYYRSNQTEVNKMGADMSIHIFEGITEKELIEGGKEVRKKLFKEMFGEN